MYHEGLNHCNLSHVDCLNVFKIHFAHCLFISIDHTGQNATTTIILKYSNHANTS